MLSKQHLFGSHPNPVIGALCAQLCKLNDQNHEEAIRRAFDTVLGLLASFHVIWPSTHLKGGHLGGWALYAPPRTLM